MRGRPRSLPKGWRIRAQLSPFGTLEDGFARRLRSLPRDSRLLLTLAAAEPLGDPTLLWHAAERLGLGWDAATTAETSGLIEFGVKVRFRHPLVRAAAYREASTRERLDVHRALAEVTDPIVDPDRRVWHRANATVTQDDEIAVELDAPADRAKSRGGLLAASALFERAALLTTDAARRADRTLAAAAAKRDVGALDAALGLLPAVEANDASDLRRAQVDRLRGQIAFDQRRGADAVRLLLSAATQLESLDRSARARDVPRSAVRRDLGGQSRAPSGSGSRGEGGRARRRLRVSSARDRPCA